MFEINRRELQGAREANGLFFLDMHHRIIGQRSRIWILEEIIRLAQFLDEWFATHAEFARCCGDKASGI